MTIKIDRSRLFDPNRFKKYSDGRLFIGRENPSSLILDELDLENISFVREFCGESHFTMLRRSGSETWSVESNFLYIPLDAQIFMTLYYNQHLIPKEWMVLERVVFHGTKIETHAGYDRFICLSLDGERWDCEIKSPEDISHNGVYPVILR